MLAFTHVYAKQRESRDIIHINSDQLCKNAISINIIYVSISMHQKIIPAISFRQELVIPPVSRHGSRKVHLTVVGHKS